MNPGTLKHQISLGKNDLIDPAQAKPLAEDAFEAQVEFLDGKNHRVHYVRQPFRREPDFGVTSVNYDFAELLARAQAPR